MKLFSKSSNLYDHDTSTSQTDGRADGQTETCLGNAALRVASRGKNRYLKASGEGGTRHRVPQSHRGYATDVISRVISGLPNVWFSVGCQLHGCRDSTVPHPHRPFMTTFTMASGTTTCRHEDLSGVQVSSQARRSVPRVDDHFGFGSLYTSPFAYGR